MASTGEGDAIGPVAAWSEPAQRFLVGWAADGPAPSSLAVTRLTSSAEVLDPNGIGLGVGDFDEAQGVRDVAWNGSRFVVLFETRFIPANNGASFVELYGQTVNTAGATRPRFLIAEGAPTNVVATVSRGPESEVGVAYDLLTMSICCPAPTPPYTGSDRVFLRTVS